MQTIQTVSAIQQRTKPIGKRRGCSEEPETFRSFEPLTNGFLRTTFLPKYAKGDNNSLLQAKKAERDLQKSLSLLTEKYGAVPVDITDKAFPYNILLAHWSMERQISRQCRDKELFMVAGKGGHCFATKETVNVGRSLYFIPVLPLYRLLQDKKNKHCAELLLSVFSYLYHNVRIPYFRGECSEMDGFYSMTAEWLCSSPEEWENPEEWNKAISEWNAAMYYGDDMERKIYSHYQLDHFEQRLQDFEPKNEFEQMCKAVAGKAYNLFEVYPDRTILDHMDYEASEDEEDDYYSIIRPEQYISFVAETKGWLADVMISDLNTHLNECSSIAVPTIQTLFNKKHKTKEDTLDFEVAIFNLIGNLDDLLNT